MTYIVHQKDTLFPITVDYNEVFAKKVAERIDKAVVSSIDEWARGLAKLPYQQAIEMMLELPNKHTAHALREWWKDTCNVEV